MSKYKKWLSVLCILTSALMMMACSSSTKPSATIEVLPPPDLIQPCAPLPKLEGSTGKVILPWATSVVDKYNDCANRHDALVKAWPKAEN